MVRKERIEHSVGYWLVLVEKHPYANRQGRVPEHRVVMEKKIGRYINPEVEVVHHIDHNRKNNNLSNLLLISISEHKRYDLGWEKRYGKWYKICKKCSRDLEVCEENFYKRKSGDLEYFHICKNCAVAKAMSYWKNNNGVEKQKARRARQKLLEVR